jgi:hypothetical protein
LYCIWIKSTSKENKADGNPTVDHEIGLKTLHTYIRRQTSVSVSTEGAGIEGVKNNSQ